jgi:hypothetical protein
MNKQPISFVVLLDLVLLDLRESLSSLVLPLLLLVKCMLYGGLILFNASESGANLLPVHLLFMVPLSKKDARPGWKWWPLEDTSCVSTE